MKLEEGILYLDSSYDNEQINELSPKLHKKLEEITEVVLDEKSVVATSALFALIASLKRSKKDIKVSIFEKNTNFASLGNVTFI